jgi:hypothetical protein
MDDIAAAKRMMDNRQRWQTLVGLTNPTRATRAAEIFTAGETSVGWIDFGLPLMELQAMRDVLPVSKQDEHNREYEAQYIVAKSLTAEHVQAYGPTVRAVCLKEDVDAWKASDHTPAALRSLYPRSSRAELGELISDADIGSARGKYLAAYLDASTSYGGAKTALGLAWHLSPE